MMAKIFSLILSFVALGLSIYSYIRAKKMIDDLDDAVSEYMKNEMNNKICMAKAPRRNR